MSVSAWGAFVEAILIGLAALYLWVLASQLHTPVIGGVQRWLRRGWRRPLISCPWCSGFWISAVLVAVVQWMRWDWIGTPLTILASATIVGLIGSNWTAGIDDEE